VDRGAGTIYTAKGGTLTGHANLVHRAKEQLMSTTLEQAKNFFEACETGKGWEVCQAYCHPDATFSSQTGALAGIDTLEGYCNWMRDLFTPLPDARYDLKAFAEDPERHVVTAFAVFHATHSGPGGPVEATGKHVTADYVYAMAFDGDRIRHLTKVWHDGISLAQLGWA
jgi:predicted ester cyclase